MSARKAANDAVFELIKLLDPHLKDGGKDEVFSIINRWFANNFHEFGAITSLDIRHADRAEDLPKLKEHLIRGLLINSALGIAAECAFGEEEFHSPAPWLTSEEEWFKRRKEYRPAWKYMAENSGRPPMTEIKLSFMAMRRRPIVCGPGETPPELLKRLKV
jgi:hypothetical protein